MPQTLNPTGAPSLFGGMGRLEWSAANPDDPFPVWQDITQFVRTEDNPLRITRGRQSELDQVQPSQLTCDLDNSDNRFTFGYTGGPYGSTWTPAKKVRYSETIAGRTFVEFTGWIEFPDISDWRPIGYQSVQLTCTDRLTRLSRGRPFVSTLAEHILKNNRNGALKGYWPMADTSLSFADITGQQPPLTAAFPDFTQQRPSLVVPKFQDQVVTPGDDLATVTLGYDPVNMPQGTALASTLAGGGIPLAAGQVVTVIAWLAPDFPDPTNNIVLAQSLPLRVDVTETPATSGGFVGWFGASFPDPRWTGGALSTNLHYGSNSAVTLPLITTGWALPVMVQYGYSPNVAGARYGAIDLGPYTFLGSTPSSMTLTTMWAPYREWAGTIAHVQLYVGAPGDFTVADYLAQHQMGLYGLERQLTGARINTILDYAGVPATDRAIDPGVSYMQRAKLAGLDPYTAIQQAIAVERGRFIAAGDGRAVFHDRIRTLNV